MFFFLNDSQGLNNILPKSQIILVTNKEILEEIKLHKEQFLTILKCGHPLNIAEFSCTHRKTIRNIISFVDYDIHAF